jgi:hypothetical protein
MRYPRMSYDRRIGISLGAGKDRGGHSPRRVGRRSVSSLRGLRLAAWKLFYSEHRGGDLRRLRLCAMVGEPDAA